jgi:hypothetical protein
VVTVGGATPGSSSSFVQAKPRNMRARSMLRMRRNLMANLLVFCGILAMDQE